MKIDELRSFVILSQVIQFEHSKRMMNSTFFEFINIQSTTFHSFCYIAVVKILNSEHLYEN